MINAAEDTKYDWLLFCAIFSPISHNDLPNFSQLRAEVQEPHHPHAASLAPDLHSDCPSASNPDAAAPGSALHTNPLTAMTTHLPPQLSLRQQQIRMNIESDIARAIPIAGPSAPQQQRDDYEIA